MLTLLREGRDQLAPDAPTLRIGGDPLATTDTRWPACRVCDQPMTFRAFVPVASESGRVSAVCVFACGSGAEAGCFDLEFESARAAILVDAERRTAFERMRPPAGTSCLPAMALEPHEVEIQGGQSERDAYADARRRGDVRGKLGGAAFWLFAHGNEDGEYRDPLTAGTPGSEHRNAPYCACQLARSRKPKKGAQEMTLMAQIERFPFGDPAAPVTDSCAYVLLCPACRSAVLLLDG